MKKRLYAGICGAAAVALLFWLGGFDFDHRGEGAFMCGLACIGAGCIAAFLLIDERNL